jgi:hypothetical protein
MIVLGWNVYPVESVSYSTGAKHIPLGIRPLMGDANYYCINFQNLIDHNSM